MPFNPRELHPGGQGLMQFRDSRLLSVQRILYIRGDGAGKLNGHGFES